MNYMDIADRFAAMDHSFVVLHSDRCLHSQDRFSQCEQCYFICPETAISPGKPPNLNQTVCKSCYACLVSCPTGAYQADDDVVSLLTCAARIDTQSIELVCGKHTEPDKGDNPERTAVQIQGCLAGLGSGALAAIFSIGFRQIILRTDACDRCKWSSLNQIINQQAEQANQLLSAWISTPVVECASKPDVLNDRLLFNAKNPPLSRRDLFRLASKQSQTALARAMEPKPTEKGKFISRDRYRLLAAINHLPEPTNFSAIQAGAFNFALLEVSEACTACGTCARVCPSSALNLDMDEIKSSFQLVFDAKKCIACEACQHVCIPGAIQINRAPSLEAVFAYQVTILAEGKLSHCQKCGVAFAPKGNVKFCLSCEFRRKNPFGVSSPSGFISPEKQAGNS